MDTNTQDPTQIVPPAAVGSLHKEAGPSLTLEQSVVEVLQPSEVEPVLHPEVAEAGVEVSKDAELPDLTAHDKNAGLSHAPVITPIPDKSSVDVVLPMSETDAIETLKKNNNPKNSIAWYLVSVLRQFKKMHQRLSGGN